MILLDLIWGCVVLTVLFSISFGSYCLLGRSVRSAGRNAQTGHVFSLSNCFASGVFLSTCFLGLLPHVRKQEEHIRIVWAKAHDHSDSSSHIFLSSELIVLVGFLLILLIEEVVRSFQKPRFHGTMERCSRTPEILANGKTYKHAPAITEGGVSAATRIGTLPTLLGCDEDTEPLVSDNLSTEDFADEADNMPTIEFRQINDEITQGYDHGGHSHLAFLSSDMSLGTFALLLGLSTHSVFEGIALGMQQSSREFYGLLIGILLHEVLCSFAYGVSLAQQKTSLKTAFISSLILASSIPVGMLSSVVIVTMETLNALLCRLVLESLAAGTFIYVACVEMLNSELNAHVEGAKQGLSKVATVIVGVFAFFFISTIFGNHNH